MTNDSTTIPRPEDLRTAAIHAALIEAAHAMRELIDNRRAMREAAR